MDPYLEAAGLWPLFQDTLVACFRDAIQPGLADRYEARVRERRYTDRGDSPLTTHLERLRVARPLRNLGHFQG